MPESFNEQIFSALAPIPIPISTPFMAFPKFYAANCVDNDGVYLEVNQATEVKPKHELRWAPIAYANPFLSTAPPFGSGLHQYDYALAMGDLLEGTQKRAKQLVDESQFCVVP